MAAFYRLPKRGYAGLALIAVGWPLAWIRPAGIEFVWENSFLFLWVGYILVVDALNWRRSGTSLFTRDPKAWFSLFIISIPGWWLFEFLNLFLQNWCYIHNRPLGTFEYAVRSSIHFSVVIPAVLTTAELWASSRLLAWLSYLPGFALPRRKLVWVTSAGLIMLVLVMMLPRLFFPLVWISLYLIFDSINMWRGSPSLLLHMGNGNWRPAFALGLGALSCGFFWEMWNFYSLPKWVYSIPFVDFGYIFEMPVLGYLGYLPFGLEVYALYIFVIEMLGLQKTFLYGGDGYIRIDR